MKKEYIVGGLAIVGAIALFAYLKPKKRLNSDGFYGADGKMSSPNLTNPFMKIKQEVCNLPNNFVRRVFTNAGGINKSYCGRYDRVVTLTPSGKAFQYRLRREIPNTTFINGGFINSNGTSMGTSYQIINSSEYENAFINGQNC